MTFPNSELIEETDSEIAKIDQAAMARRLKRCESELTEAGLKPSADLVMGFYMGLHTAALMIQSGLKVTV